MEHKSDSTSSLLRFLRMVKVQHGVNVAIVHVDNDTVLINQATKTDLAMVGTVFEPSTTYRCCCHHERTKHVDIYYHYIKDRVRDGYLQLQHVGTKDMAADGLTKPLEDVAHNRFLHQVGLRKPELSPRPQAPPGG
jgi:hypothetical protein